MESPVSFKSKFTIIDFIIEAFALAALISIWTFAIYTYPKLPDIIPAHINYNGLADEYRSKIYFFIIPVMAILIYALLTFLNRDRILLRSPERIIGNDPEKTYKMTRKFVRILKFSILLLFAFFIYEIALIANQIIILPAYWWWLVPLILIVIPIAIFFLLIAIQKKPEKILK